MAFILANGGSCSPAWDGTDPVSSDTQVAGVINEVRSDGGDVIVSAGGYNGTKLGQVCSSAAATAAAYQQVITTYGLHAFDFDLEEPEIENSTAIANELGAAQILQQEDPGLFISITMPSTTTGANYFGQLLLDEAKSLGFTPERLHDHAVRRRLQRRVVAGHRAAGLQLAADEHVRLEQLAGVRARGLLGHERPDGHRRVLLPERLPDGAELRGEHRHEQVHVLVGQPGPGMQPARQQRLTVQRVQQRAPRTRGTSPRTRWPSPTTRGTSPSADAHPRPQSHHVAHADADADVGWLLRAAWVSNMAYVSGNVVSYNGDKWTANQWNYDEVPGGSSGAWNNDGAC